MKCPYCENEMISGKICSISRNSGLVWKDSEEQIRLNDEPKLVARINGDRISGYICKNCNKIIIDYFPCNK